jgi:thioredoxin-like negative regulator of GroEL
VGHRIHPTEVRPSAPSATPSDQRPALAVAAKYARTEVTTRELTAENFKRTVCGHDNVLVYFWAPLCAPCEVFKLTYEASSDKHPDIVHGTVNFETEHDLVGLAQVRLLPTLMAFREGALVFKQAGIANPSAMDDLVRHLKAHRADAAGHPARPVI